MEDEIEAGIAAADFRYQVEKEINFLDRLVSDNASFFV